MTRTNDIDRFAEQAGFPARMAFSDLSDLYPRLERFAALVAAAERKRIESRPWGAGTEWIVRAVEAEREACAKVCDRMAVRSNDIRAAALESAAENIRARRQA
jgi:hypothetical protein